MLLYIILYVQFTNFIFSMYIFLILVAGNMGLNSFLVYWDFIKLYRNWGGGMFVC